MIRNLLSVGGFTLLSRITGFARDIVLAATLGAGFMTDAFVVAFRLPNHFRAIFGEGAFNAAFVPSYARVLETEGATEARKFSSRIFTLLLASQILLLILALVFTPFFVDLLAPGFRSDPRKFDLAVALTRVTFPYLMFVTLVTLHSGVLNANGKFAAAAFAPVLLNLTMIVALSLAFLFPNAGYAAATGVAVAGFAELLLLEFATRRAGIGSNLTRPKWDADAKQFFKALGPAVIGSAGVQIALFADTIISSLLPTGGPSSIYYADRIYQLPIGVIGIAAGTVLLPEMSRAFAAGAPEEAIRAQNRTMALTIALATPFFIAFLTIPELIMRGVFVRGRFTEADALASAHVLGAYAIGLLAIVLISSARASFQARGDTTIPMIASLTAVALNVGLKIFLYKPLGAPGLALATALGAWINFGILVVLALRAGAMRPNAVLTKVAIASLGGALALAALALFGESFARAATAPLGQFAVILELALLALAGMATYVLVFFGVARAIKLDLSALKGARRRSKPGAATQETNS
ncbi:MAG: murein biosynthesis integral membrane protein MurJ [Methylobacteriaceae bacterium]|nr:murein biosynthesis integral membrane protein MurJ [Methylobacteriaceae bacterium]